MNDDEEFKSALFRFSLISRPLHSDDSAERQRTMRETAGKEINIPNSEKKRLTVKTIKNYPARYSIGGLEGLCRKPRNDKNTVKSISDDIIQLLKELKREKPERGASRIIRLVNARQEYKDIQSSERTISRVLKNSGLARKNLKPKKIHRRFEMDTINDLWETDISDGIFLTRENRKTFCFAFLDE